MSIREFELYHGAVLAKLVRSDRPLALRMIETRAGTDWSTYTLNDEVNLFVAHSKVPRAYTRDGGGHAWQFVFSPNQMRQIGVPANGKPVWLALVCVDPNAAAEVCLLSPEDAAQVLNLEASEQNLTIRKPSGRAQFRVLSSRREAFKVPRGRLDSWEVPGS